MAYSEEDLRNAFKAGWKERDKSPGLRRSEKKSLNNTLRSAMGGGRFNDFELVPDHKTYSHSIWLRSSFKKALKSLK